MKSLAKFRHILAPLAGVFVLLVASLSLDISLLGALVAGCIGWIGTAIGLKPSTSSRSNREREGLVYYGLAMETDLGIARDRCNAVTRAAQRIEADSVRQSLERVAEAGDVMVDEVALDPGEYARVRKVLVPYLSRTASIADGLASRQLEAWSDDDLRQVVATLDRLADVFVQHRGAMFEKEALAMDERLAALEGDLADAAVSETEQR